MRALLALCLTLLVGGSVAAKPVTISGSTLSATFEDGTLVAAQNLLTGERYFAPGGGETQVGLTGEKGLVPAGKVKGATIPGGYRWTAVTAGGQPATITTTARVDEETGGLTVVQQVSRRAGGIGGVEWGWRGLDLERAKLLVPGAGGVIINPGRTEQQLNYEYPGGWQAQMVVAQGAKGGLWLWTEDPLRRFKHLRYSFAQGKAGLRFAVETDGDPRGQKAFTSVTWRLACYRGDWQVPAARYQAVMAKSFGLTPLAKRQPEWLRDIALVVRTGMLAEADLRRLAAAVPPGRTLLYVPDWRTFSYDEMYPEYAARPGVKEWVQQARGMGFHVMLHFNLVGIHPDHELRPKLDHCLQRYRWNGELAGWYLDRPQDRKHQIVCLDPAYPEARRVLVDRMAAAWRAIGFDAMHLDFPVLINSRQGRVGGMNALGGGQRLLLELGQAMPGVALGTEGIHEVLLPCSFAQVGEVFWNYGERMGTYHPIRTCLFSPYNRLYGHLGMPDPVSSTTAYIDAALTGLRLGQVPTLPIYGETAKWDAPGVKMALQLGRLWAEHGLAPAFDLKAGEEVMAWRGAGGFRLGLAHLPEGWRLGDAANPVLFITDGVGELPAPWAIAGWPAQDERGVYALDDSRRYLAGRERGAAPPVRLARPSTPMALRTWYQGERQAVFELTQPSEGLWRAETALGQARLLVLTKAGKLLPLQGKGSFQLSAAPCLGEQRQGIFAHPPWEGVAAGGSTIGEFRLQLPAGPGLVLRFATGMADVQANPGGQPTGDGASFAVAIDGKEVFRRQHPRDTGWREGEVDLGPWAGKTVTLRLITGPGPAGDVSFDWAYWSGVRLERRAPIRGMACELVSDRPAAATVPAAEASGTGPYRYRFQGRGDRLWTALLWEVTPVSLPAKLADLPFSTATVSGGLGRAGGVFGAGGVGDIEIGGVTRRSINGHTPDQGQSRLDWNLALPDQPAHLRFHYGVREGGMSVTFLVSVNGEQVWARPMPEPQGWQEADLDLGRWAGQTVVLSLITDSDGGNTCDWGAWGEPRVE